MYFKLRANLWKKHHGAFRVLVITETGRDPNPFREVEKGDHVEVEILLGAQQDLFRKYAKEEGIPYTESQKRTFHFHW